MRIVMVLQRDPDADARTEQEASALARAGHTVIVLARRSESLPEREERNGYLVRRSLDDVDPTARRPLPPRSRLSAALQDTAGLQPDVIHAHGTLTLPFAVRLAEACHVPLIFDARELYSDMLQSESLNTPGSVIKRWARTERDLVPKAAAVIAPSDGIAMELRRRYQRDATVVRTVPALVPAGRLDRGRLRRALGLPGGTLIALYQGPLKQGRGLGVLLRALERLPQMDLAVQAEGPWREGFLRQVERRGVAERVHLMAPVERDDAIAWASGADVGVVLPEGLSLNAMLSVPDKLYEYLMAGIPVLGSDYRDIATIIGAGRCGITCDPSDADAVVGALLHLNEAGSDGRALMGARARRLAETAYNQGAETRTLLALYERVMERSTS